jgi:hypothetical protein
MLTGVVQECVSRFSSLAAGRLPVRRSLDGGGSAARDGCRSTSRRPTSPSKTRVGGSRCPPSGRKCRQARSGRRIATGSKACDHKNASGRRRWPNRDPIGVAGGNNLYGFARNDPENSVDMDGRLVGKCGLKTLLRLVGEALAPPVATLITAEAACEVVIWGATEVMYPDPGSAPLPKPQKPTKPKPPVAPPAPKQPFVCYHYSTYPPAMFAGGLWSGSSATTISGLSAEEASAGLGIPLPIYEYPITVDPNVTPVEYPGLVPPNRFGPGGLPELYFRFGTPPGSVGVPRLVPKRIL